MGTLSKFASTAALALATTLVLSCSSGDDEGGGNSSGDKYAYCVFVEQQACIASTASCVENGGMLGNTCPADYIKPSSSSGGGTSSPSGGGNVESVTIGTQVWMKKNLDVEVDGSKCYNDDPANCAIYGRLYDWATAMDLPESCNTNLCTDQMRAKHQGICPNGWHIPSVDECQTLISYVESQKGCTDCAGKHLRAADGWNDLVDGSSGNGLDSYNFTALASGEYDKSRFKNIGSLSGWWTTSRQNDFGHTYIDPIFMNMQIHRERIGFTESDVGMFVSVRCVKD